MRLQALQDSKSPTHETSLAKIAHSWRWARHTRHSQAWQPFTEVCSKVEGGFGRGAFGRAPFGATITELHIRADDGSTHNLATVITECLRHLKVEIDRL